MKSTTIKQVAPTTAAAILGGAQPRRRPPEASTAPSRCFACSQPLTAVRMQALKDLGTPQARWACMKCSTQTTAPRLGIYMGEVGTSELKLVDRIYEDSVREIFMESPDVDTVTKEEKR